MTDMGAAPLGGLLSQSLNSNETTTDAPVPVTDAVVKTILLNRQQGPQQPVVYGNYFQSEEEGVHVIYMPGAEPTPEPTPDPSNNETETGNQQTNSLVGGGSQGQFIYMFDGDKVRKYIDLLKILFFINISSWK